MILLPFGPRARPWRSLLVLPVLLLGCEGAAAPLDAGRAPDGLLSRRDLQAVVESQVARDADALVAFLASEDPAVRARAAFALGSLQDVRAARALGERLWDAAAPVRADAAFALGQLPQGTTGLSNVLAVALQEEEDPDVRLALVEALGKVADRAGADALAALDPADFEEAARALALSRTLVRGVASEPAVEALIGLLAHADASVRHNAAWGLGRAPAGEAWNDRGAHVASILDGYQRDDPAAAHLLRALGALQDTGSVVRISDWLASAPDWRTRVAAAEALATPRMAAAAREALLAALDDPSPHVRVAAGSSLTGAALAEADLDRLASWIDAHPGDRNTAGPLLRALALGGREEAVRRWLDAAAADDPWRWRQGLAAAALLESADAVPLIARAVRSPSPAVQRAAVDGLSLRWFSDRDDPALRPLYREAFAHAARAPDPETAGVAARMLQDPAFAGAGAEPAGSAPATSASDPAERRMASPFPALDWSALGALGEAPRLELETDRGTVVLRLHTEQAPLTVQILAGLAAAGRLDGVPFHRVVPNFVVQGGDMERGDGSGVPDFRLPTEATRIPFGTGTAGMARAGRDSEGSQFFITHSPQPHLDGGYTAFATVVEGMDVVDRLQEGDRVVGARVEATGAGR